MEHLFSRQIGDDSRTQKPYGTQKTESRTEPGRDEAIFD